jgi:hypothetical protein
MEKLKHFSKRLFTLRNLAPMLIILGAIIGSLGLSPFGIQFTNEQIILALLAFLAIDSLVERLDLLSDIEEGIKHIRNAVTAKVNATMFFKKGVDFPRMEQLIKDARKDIWIAGVTLESTMAISGDLVEKMEDGCSIRILALNPRGKNFRVASEYFNVNPEYAPDRIEAHLRNIYSRLAQSKNGSFEIRIIDTIVSTGYLIIDHESQNGWMNVRLYLYGWGAKNAPLFALRKSEDPVWFEIYLTQYKKAWEDATQFSPPPPAVG